MRAALSKLLGFELTEESLKAEQEKRGIPTCKPTPSVEFVFPEYLKMRNEEMMKAKS